jgi:hypothetical protein
LRVTGHSLGASLVYPSAVFLAWDIKLKVPIEVYTFGAARVFNRKMVKYWSDKLMAPNGPITKSFRFVNGQDVVTQVPLRRTLLTQYTHVPREVWMKPDGTTLISKNDRYEEDEEMSWSKHKIDFKDHNMYFGHFLNDGADHRCLYSSKDNFMALGRFTGELSNFWARPITSASGAADNFWH